MSLTHPRLLGPSSIDRSSGATGGAAFGWAVGASVGGVVDLVLTAGSVGRPPVAGPEGSREAASGRP